MAAKLHSLVGMPQAVVGIAAVTVQLPELLEHVEREAADNTACSAQSFQQPLGHAEPAGGYTAGAAVELEAEVVGSAAPIDQEQRKLRGCILVQEVADRSQVLHTVAAEELRLRSFHGRLREIVDIVGCLQLLHLSGMQMVRHLGLEAGHWDCRTYLGLKHLFRFKNLFDL